MLRSSQKPKLATKKSDTKVLRSLEGKKSSCLVTPQLMATTCEMCYFACCIQETDGLASSHMFSFPNLSPTLRLFFCLAAWKVIWSRMNERGKLNSFFAHNFLYLYSHIYWLWYRPHIVVKFRHYSFFTRVFFSQPFFLRFFFFFLYTI